MRPSSGVIWRYVTMNGGWVEDMHLNREYTLRISKNREMKSTWIDIIASLLLLNLINLAPSPVTQRWRAHAAMSMEDWSQI